MPQNIAQRRDLRNWSKADELIEIATAIDQFAPGSVIPLNADKEPMVKGWQADGVSLGDTCGYIRAAAERDPENHPMIGLRMGKATGLVVVDLDLKERAEYLHDDVRAKVRELLGVPSFVAVTPSGGEHWFYRHAGEGCRNLRESHGLPVDVKGEGGQVAIAPSWRSDNRAYRWADFEDAGAGWAMLLDGIDALPCIKPGVIEVQPVGKRKTQNVKPATVHSFRAGDPVEEGGRNDALFHAVFGYARDSGAGDNMVTDFAHDHNTRWMAPALPDGEVMKVVASVLRMKRGPGLWAKGGEAQIVVPMSLLKSGIDPATLLLWQLLEGMHGAKPGSRFAVSDYGMHAAQVLPGWGRKLYARCRDDLEARDVLLQVEEGGRNGRKSTASQYRLMRRLRDGLPEISQQEACR